MDFKLTLAAAVLATVSGQIELGLSSIGMFHCLLRPGKWREVTWKDIHIFQNSQTARYPNVFEIPGSHAPKTRRQQVHAKVQHALVECPGLAQLLKALQLRVQVSGAVSLYSGSRRATCRRFSSCPSSILTSLTVSFTLAGFRGGGATDYLLRCRDVPALRRRMSFSSEKTLERYVQEGVYYLESLSLPTRAANLVAELSDLAPQVFHETAAALLSRLPTPTPSTCVWKRKWKFVSEMSQSTVGRSGI